jgi:hypothetical protein
VEENRGDTGTVAVGPLATTYRRQTVKQRGCARARVCVGSIQKEFKLEPCGTLGWSTFSL